MNKKLLIIGLDGGCWHILNTAVSMGFMPFLEKLKNSGFSANLQSVIPPKTPGAWSTFHTGCYPGMNGIFDFSYWDINSRRKYYVNSNMMKTPFWEILSNSGNRVCLLNVPLTYPVRKINGCLVSGIMTPSVETDFTWPLDLKYEILANVPDYHIFNLNNIKKDASKKNLHSLIATLTDILDSRLETAKFLMSKEPFDFFMVHFQALDILQHTCWSYIDENSKQFGNQETKFIFSHFFKKLDECIKLITEEFVEKNKQDPLVMLVSDHGFQKHLKRFNFGTWLLKEKFSKLNKVRNKPFKVFRKILKIKKEPFDWDSSRVFSFSRGSYGYVYFLHNKNDNFKQDFLKKVSSIKDPQTNLKIVEKYKFKEEIYSGDKLDLMPDVILFPEKGYSFTGDIKESDTLFVEVTEGEDFHIGMHSSDGILLIKQNDIVNKPENINVSIADIAPTVLSYFDLPVPDYTQGKAMDRILDIKERKSAYKEESGHVENSMPNHKENKMIEERLRRLGYIE